MNPNRQLRQPYTHAPSQGLRVFPPCAETRGCFAFENLLRATLSSALSLLLRKGPPTMGTTSLTITVSI